MIKKLSILVGILLLSQFSLSAKNYKGGELYSRETVKYGRFDVRMRPACASGVISSFFLYYDNSYLGSPEPWQEIDIEIVGKNCNAFQSNIITGTAQSKKTSEEIHTIEKLVENYHTYTIEWTPQYIAWFIDGKEVRRSTDTQVKECQQKEMSYRFNLWISDAVAWAGQFNSSALPLYQYINWIKYSKYTPGTGTNGTDFTLEWVEDFNSFNSSRWGKGDWSFDGNLVDFLPSNIVVKDVYCILCLTSNNNTGFSGEIPKDIETPVINTGSISPLKIYNNRNFQDIPSFEISINGRLFPKNLVYKYRGLLINNREKDCFRTIKFYE